ncbi:MAG: alpha/beta hydrolase [Hyphomonadaceae bacterium]|nr:alpha/beta hydrolase [Hyphomonadaceae bacterium]
MTTAFWRKQVEPLSRRFRVISVDPRCHGQSGNVAHGLRMARLGADMHELLLALSLRNVNAVGWSMGASILLSMFDIFGSGRVRTFTFVDQPPKLLNEDGWNFGAPGVTRATLNGQTEAIVSGQREFLTQFIPSMFYVPPSESDLAWMLQECLHCPAELAAAMLVDHCNQDWRDVLSRIDKPVMVMAGAHSAARDGAKIMASLIPNCRFHEFPHSKHCPFLEETDAFNAALRSFVTKREAV